MKRFRRLMIVIALLCAPASSACAAAPGDDLRQCILKSVTPADREALATMGFLAMAQHPSAKPYARVSPAQMEAAARRQAAVFQRLLTADCRAQVLAALKIEGVAGIGPAGQALGRLSIDELTRQSDVKIATNSAFDYVDRTQLDALLKDAGLPEER